MHMCTGGQIKAKGRIEAFLTPEDIIDMKDCIPLYYKDRLNTCVGGVVINSIDKEDKSILSQMVRYGTSDGEVAVGNQTNPLYVSLKNDELMQEDLLHINTEAIVEKDESIEKVINIVKFMKFIHKYINSKGYIYSY